MASIVMDVGSPLDDYLRGGYILSINDVGVQLRRWHGPVFHDLCSVRSSIFLTSAIDETELGNRSDLRILPAEIEGEDTDESGDNVSVPKPLRTPVRADPFSGICWDFLYVA